MTSAQTNRRPDGDKRTLGRPSPHDFLNVDAHLSDEEREIRAGVRSFVEDRILPNINYWFERAHFPRELVPEMGSLGVLGMNLKGYGCAGKSAVAYGLACKKNAGSRPWPAARRSAASASPSRPPAPTPRA